MLRETCSVVTMLGLAAIMPTWKNAGEKREVEVAAMAELSRADEAALLAELKPTDPDPWWPAPIAAAGAEPDRFGAELERCAFASKVAKIGRATDGYEVPVEVYRVVMDSVRAELHGRFGLSGAELAEARFTPQPAAEYYHPDVKPCRIEVGGTVTVDAAGAGKSLFQWTVILVQDKDAGWRVDSAEVVKP